MRHEYPIRPEQAAQVRPLFDRLARAIADVKLATDAIAAGDVPAGARAVGVQGNTLLFDVPDPPK